MLSRRTLFSWLSAYPASSRSVVYLQSDAVLIELGRQFDCVAWNIDRAIEGKEELYGSMLERMDELVRMIDSQSATTLDGLRVKARVAAWGLLGDLEAKQNCGLAQDMSKSILRDLIRNFDPSRERTGAVTRLLDSIIS